MFAVDHPQSIAILPMAEQMFLEFQAFGCLCIDQNMKEKQLELYVRQRVRNLISTFQPLEAKYGLRFNEIKIPYLSLAPNWPESHPIAGYTGSQDPVSPSSVVETYAACWMAEIVTQSLVRYLLRGALYRSTQSGLQEAISFLFDLFQQGWVVSSDSLVTPVLALLAVRSNVDSDEAMVRHFYGGQMPQTRQEWLETRFAFERPEVKELSPECRPVVLSLLERGVKEIEVVRAAQTWDDWFVGQFKIRGLLSAIRRIVLQCFPNVPIGVQALLSQWEEVIADAFGFTSFRRVPEGGSRDGRVAGLRTISRRFLSKDG